ncbi:hypothetical protein GCM10009087_19180 [Sphingomonas oligophenolica]
MAFEFIQIWSRSRRRARAQADALFRSQILKAAADQPGPPAIALARSRYADRADVAIDPLETQCRLHTDGIEVRAWVLVPHGDVPPRLAGILAPSIAKLSQLSPRVRQIFFLRTAYGIPMRDIAVLLDIPRRSVRRAILTVIAALDSKPK